MLRLFWLIVVGSWRFPWEQVPSTLLRVPKVQTCVVDYCNAHQSPVCDDGRCRHHCALNCECEERPLTRLPETIELPREGGTYRSPPTE